MMKCVTPYLHRVFTRFFRDHYGKGYGYEQQFDNYEHYMDYLDPQNYSKEAINNPETKPGHLNWETWA